MPHMSETTTIRIARAIYDRIARIAEAERRAIKDQAELLLEKALAEEAPK